ncbi:hypothetical protein, partial [Kocuria rosea]|uniref:hypothetical protein n=1 Tax=Kocuria rosea TaxID=1275 RepID=UPI001C931390
EIVREGEERLRRVVGAWTEQGVEGGVEELVRGVELVGEVGEVEGGMNDWGGDVGRGGGVALGEWE